MSTFSIQLRTSKSDPRSRLKFLARGPGAFGLPGRIGFGVDFVALEHFSTDPG